MFRSLTVYQLTQATDAVASKLDKALGRKPFKECGKQLPAAAGFVKPLGEDSETITYETDDAVLFCVRSDEKVVPPAALKLLISAKAREESKKKEKAAAKDDREFTGLNKTDLRLIKENVTSSLLPTTLPTPSWTYAYLDKSLAMLFVGATDAAADRFMTVFSAALGGSPFLLLGIQSSDPCDFYTKWLEDPSQLGDCFELGHDCSLKHPKEGGTAIINVKREDLESDEIHALLEAGKECCRIALEHADMTFAITAKLGVRSIALARSLRADLEDQGDPASRSASEFALYVRAVRQVMRDLGEALGGWPKQEILDLGDTQEDVA